MQSLISCQYESISVGNFALTFTTTLLAPTLAREFQADDSFGLFTEAWLVALKQSGTTWHKEMAAVFERAATAAHATLVPLGQVSQLRELVDWRHGKQRNLAALEAFARLSPPPDSTAEHLDNGSNSPDPTADPLINQPETAPDIAPTQATIQDVNFLSNEILNSPQASITTTAHSDIRAQETPLAWNIDRLALMNTSSEATSSGSRDGRIIQPCLTAVPPTPPLARRTRSPSSMVSHTKLEAKTNSSASSDELIPGPQLSTAAEHGPKPPPACVSDTSPCPNKDGLKRRLLQHMKSSQHRQRLSYMVALALFFALGASCLSLLLACRYHAPGARLDQSSLTASWLTPQRQDTCLNAVPHYSLPLRPTQSKAILKMSRPGPSPGGTSVELALPTRLKQ